MKIYVKNKFASIGGGSKVTDESGKEIFKVKGKIFSITKKKKILDKDGRLLYIVKNKFFNIWTHSSFILDSQKQKIARVKNRSFKAGFDVLGYGDEIAVDGFLMSGCTINKNGESVGMVKSGALSLTDTYEVTVSDNEDPAFIVALIVAMDNVRDNASKR